MLSDLAPISDAQNEFTEALSAFMADATRRFMCIRRQPRHGLAHCLVKALAPYIESRDGDNNHRYRIVHCSRFRRETALLNEAWSQYCDKEDDMIENSPPSRFARHIACGATEPDRVPVSDYTVAIYNRLWCPRGEEEWDTMQRIAAASYNLTVKLIFIMETQSNGIKRSYLSLNDYAMWFFYEPGGLRDMTLGELLALR